MIEPAVQYTIVSMQLSARIAEVELLEKVLSDPAELRRFVEWSSGLLPTRTDIPAELREQRLAEIETLIGRALAAGVELTIATLTTIAQRPASEVVGAIELAERLAGGARTQAAARARSRKPQTARRRP